jgi:hypothetical protein
MRVYVEKLHPNGTPESIEKIQSKILGVSGVAVRSNKGSTVFLLFRRSVVAVVEETDVFPPNLPLTQL